VPHGVGATVYNLPQTNSLQILTRVKSIVCGGEFYRCRRHHQQPPEGTSQAADTDKKRQSSKRRRRRRSRGILSAIVSGEPAPDDDSSSAVSDDSSSAEATLPSSRHRLGRGGHYPRPKTERLTSTPRGLFVTQRTKAMSFQTQKCSSLIARDHHAVDPTVVDIADRKRPLRQDGEAGPSSGMGVDDQLKEAAAVHKTPSPPSCRRKYCTWPLDARSMPEMPGTDDALLGGVFRPLHGGRLKRQNAVDLRPPSTVEVDQLSRPSALSGSASRSTGNISVDNKTDVAVKTPPPGQRQPDREMSVAVENAEPTSGLHGGARSLPRMSVTAFWNFVISRYGRGDPGSEAERLRRKQQKKKENRARKALRTITIILGAFVLCWTPWHVLSLLIGFCGGGGDGAIETSSGSSCVSTTLYDISYWLCYLNSPINPFCYAFVNYQFKKTFIRIIRLDWHRTWRILSSSIHCR